VRRAVPGAALDRPLLLDPLSRAGAPEAIVTLRDALALRRRLELRSGRAYVVRRHPRGSPGMAAFYVARRRERGR
jgi:hypothetical protein